MRSLLPGILFTVIILTACSKASPVPDPEPGLILIYCDLATLAGDAGPTPHDSLRAQIFERHGTTEAEFETALQPYRDDPRRWVPFFKAVSDTLESWSGRPAPRPSIRTPRPIPPQRRQTDGG